jgi:hypothetical protein
MALLVLFTAPLNKAQYETLRKEVNWEGNYPTGVLSHVASFDDAGSIHVADVWDSEANLNAFVGTRLTPAMQKHNLPQPEVVMYPVHNINTYAALDKYRVKG